MSQKKSARLVKIKTLGRGTYGTVYRANFFPLAKNNRGEPKSSDYGLNESTAVAVKRNIVDSNASFLVPVRELSILTQLRHHPFIVKLKTISFGNPFAASSYTNVVGNRRYTSVSLTPIPDKTLRDDNLYFIFEEAAYDGHNFIYYHNFSYGYLKLAMVQMLLAMEFIHSKGIIHRDLKPSNFLVFLNENGEPSVKISDFGLSKYITNQTPSTPRTVTAWYRAPEIVCRWRNYEKPVDMWSIGCIFYELLAKRALFYRMKDDRETIFKSIYRTIPDIQLEDMIKVDQKGLFKESYRHMEKYEKNIVWSELMSMTTEDIEKFDRAGVRNSSYNSRGTFKQFTNLLSGLLHPHPEKRLTAKEALDHEFFTEFRTYIAERRNLHPPLPDPEPIVKIVKRRERTMGLAVAFSIYNSRHKLDNWYSHRILFQALDIFDRYLVWIDEFEKKNNSKVEYKEEDILLRFMVCTYLAIKLLTTTRLLVSFQDIITPKYRTTKNISLAEAFEIDLIQEILQFKIYRLTIYEAADKINRVLTESEIYSLLFIHGSVEDFKGTPSELLTKYLSGNVPLTDDQRALANLSCKRSENYVEPHGNGISSDKVTIIDQRPTTNKYRINPFISSSSNGYSKTSRPCSPKVDTKVLTPKKPNLVTTNNRKSKITLEPNDNYKKSLNYSKAKEHFKVKPRSNHNRIKVKPESNYEDKNETKKNYDLLSSSDSLKISPESHMAPSGEERESVEERLKNFSNGCPHSSPEGPIRANPEKVECKYTKTKFRAISQNNIAHPAIQPESTYNDPSPKVKPSKFRLVIQPNSSSQNKTFPIEITSEINQFSKRNNYHRDSVVRPHQTRLVRMDEAGQLKVPISYFQKKEFIQC